MEARILIEASPVPGPGLLVSWPVVPPLSASQTGTPTSIMSPVWRTHQANPFELLLRWAAPLFGNIDRAQECKGWRATQRRCPLQTAAF